MKTIEEQADGMLEEITLMQLDLLDRARGLQRYTWELIDIKNHMPDALQGAIRRAEDSVATHRQELAENNIEYADSHIIAEEYRGRCE